jgi:hypothetical protein
LSFFALVLPPPRQKVRKVFEIKELSLDFGFGYGTKVESPACAGLWFLPDLIDDYILDKSRHRAYLYSMDKQVTSSSMVYRQKLRLASSSACPFSVMPTGCGLELSLLRFAYSFRPCETSL